MVTLRPQLKVMFTHPLKVSQQLLVTSLCLAYYLCFSTERNIIYDLQHSSAIKHSLCLIQGDPATLPQLAWQFVIIQVSEKDRVIDPVLAFGRDQTIFFYQVICTGPHDIRVSGLQKLQLSYKILSFVVRHLKYSTLLLIIKSPSCSTTAFTQHNDVNIPCIFKHENRKEIHVLKVQYVSTDLNLWGVIHLKYFEF